MEEGSEPVFFHQLFQGSIYHTGGVGIFERRGNQATEHFIEIHHHQETTPETLPDGSTIQIIKSPEQSTTLYRLTLAPSILQIHHQLDHPLTIPTPTNSYLFTTPNSNCLVLTADLESRREIIKNLTSPDGSDFFVVFSLDDYYSDYRTWVGSYCKRFVEGVEGRIRGEQSDFCLKSKMDLKLFKEFFTLDVVGEVLGKGVIEVSIKLYLAY